MYREIDFTQLGGYPLDQDTLDFLQGAYKNSIEQLAGVAVSGGAPVVLSGMAVTNSGNTVADGWLLYNGEIVPFVGGTVIPGGGEVALIRIDTATDTLTFNDGSTPTVVTTKSAVLTAGASTTTSTTFPVSALLSYAVSLGKVGREGSYGSISLAHVGSGLTGTFQYKLNSIDNTLYYSINATISTPAFFGDAPAGSNVAVGTLPVGYRPSNARWIAARATSNVGFFVGLNAGGYTNTAWLLIGSDGGVALQFAKTTGVTSVTVQASGVVQLD